MKNTTPIIFSIALSLATTVFLTVAGGTTIVTCKGVPSMPATAACSKVSGGDKRMGELCAKVLRTAPASSSITAYADRAMEAAEVSAMATYALMVDQLAHNKSLPGDLSAAYRRCGNAYFWGLIVRIHTAKTWLATCEFEKAVKDNNFPIAVASIDNCAHGLRVAGGSSLTLPLYDTVVGDRTMTMLASLLVGMVANKTSIDLA